MVLNLSPKLLLFWVLNSAVKQFLAVAYGITDFWKDVSVEPLLDTVLHIFNQCIILLNASDKPKTRTHVTKDVIASLLKEGFIWNYMPSICCLPKIVICGYVVETMTEDFYLCTFKTESSKQQKFTLTKGWEWLTWFFFSSHFFKINSNDHMFGLYITPWLAWCQSSFLDVDRETFSDNNIRNRLFKR